MNHPLLALAGLLFACCPGLRAADLHVPADFPTIQQGIDAAQAGDRVLVAPGTYAEHIDFGGKDLQVVGTGGALVTTIDGSGNGRGATFRHGETRAAVLSGFTIVNGLPPVCPAPFLEEMGGGILILDASPTIADNVIRNNLACVGGGGIGVSGGDPLIRHNRITWNGSTYGGNGAGILMVFADRGTIEDNQIEHNGPADTGGGVYLGGVGPVLVARNIIRFNTSAGDGGGIKVELRFARVHDNVIARNIGDGLGVGVYDGMQAILVNNTIADNHGHEDLLLQASREGVILLANNIVRTSKSRFSVTCAVEAPGKVRFGNGLIHASNGTTISGACDFTEGILLTDDPGFEGGALHPYWLATGSPAIDAGTDAAVSRIRRDLAGRPRIQGAAVDLGAYEARGETVRR